MFSLYFLIKRNLSKFEEIGNDDLKPSEYSFEIEGETFTKINASPNCFNCFDYKQIGFQLNYSENYVYFPGKYKLYFEDDTLEFCNESIPLKDKFPENINDWTEEIQFYFKLKHG